MMAASIGALMDRALRRLYAACAALAGVAIIVITLAVMVSIASRAMGVYVPGTTEIAGYGMAAAGSLGLAHTAINHGHVRVDLILSRLRERTRHWTELVALSASTLVIGFSAWALYRMVASSYRFGDISSNSDALPLWLPQLPLVIGFVVFAVAFAHLTLLHLMGRTGTAAPGGEATK